MKENTKLILAFLGAGVASNLLLSSAVAGATSGFPMAAAGGEGALALGGAYGAWKLKGKNRMIAAVVGGAGAGLLVNSVQSGLLSPAPAAKPAGSASPQMTPKGPSSALPQAQASTPGNSGITGLGTNSVSGTIAPGSIVPTPNRPPTAQETAGYLDYLGQEAAKQAEIARQIAQAQGGQIPVIETSSDLGGLGLFGGPQSGAAARVGMGPARRTGGFGGAGASFRRGYGA